MHFLVADFDGPAAMLDALAYAKAARASGVPAALEISQSGRGAHVWVFFTEAVSAAVARSVGTALIHEATVLRARWTCARTTGCSRTRTCCPRAASET